MTGKEVKAARQAVRMTQEAFGYALGSGAVKGDNARRMVGRWEAHGVRREMTIQAIRNLVGNVVAS